MPGNTKDVSLLSKSVRKSSELSASKNIQNVFDETRILTENADDSLKLCLACFAAPLQNECCVLSTTFRREQYFIYHFNYVDPVAFQLN